MDKITETIVATYDERLRAVVEQDRPGVPDPVVLEAARTLLFRRVSVLVPRVMVVDFHAYRERLGLPADPASSLATEAYLQDFGPEAVDRWFASYPVLHAMLDRVAANTARFLAEVADHFVADRAALVEADLLPADAGDVARLVPFDSDPHKGGTVVMGFDLDCGARLVYKPRTMAGEEAVRECIRILADGLPLDLDRCVPVSLDRGSHGWQELADGRPARDRDEAAAYYWRFGAMAALLGAIGSTDLHEENVFAAGDRPVLIDLETLLHADDQLASTDLSDGLSDRVRLSVASTLMFPQRMPSGPYSVVLGGVGIPYDQESSRTEFQLVDPGTDAVDIARRTFSLVRRQQVLSYPSGEAASVLDHYDDLQAGFLAGYRAVVERRDDLVAALDARPFTLRQIIRPTGAYARLLNAVTHPDVLASQERFDRLLNRLQPPFGLRTSQVHGFIATAERRAFEEGDVPYFAVDSRDYRLRDGDEVSAPFTHHTPVDRARIGLARMGEDQLLLEQLVIEDGISEIRRLRGAAAGRDTAPAPVAALVRPEGVDWTEVRALLRRVAVRTPGVAGDEQQGWLTGLYSESLPTYDVGSAVSLHDAAGIGTFLRRAALTSPDPGSTAELARIDAGQDALVRRYRESLGALSASVVSGPPSVTYAASLRSSDLSSLVGLASSLAADPTREDLHLDDLTKGLPGLGHLLASDPTTPPPVLRAVLDATATDGVAGRAPYDLAHGRLGVLWARYRMATALGDRDEAARATEGVLATAALTPPSTHRGWCSGAGALALVLAETFPVHQEEGLVRLHAERAATPPGGGAVDLGVCHGTAGVVQVLLQVSQHLGAPWALELAEETWAADLGTAAAAGFFTGERSKTSVLGYFHGWAGIGDTALLLERARTGERSWVPTSLALPAHSTRSLR